MAELNWAGNHAYRAKRLHRPAALDELRRVVAAAPQIRVLGTRHSFHGIADAPELVSLAALPAAVEVDRAAGTASFGAATTYGELAPALAAEGVALHAMASLPHISVAGAVATATHGSGDTCGNLATAVAALELVTSDGDVVRTARGHADFDGTVVSLGALGAVTRITLDVEPHYDVRQRVFEGLAWEALFAHFDDVTRLGESVSVFTTWGDAVDQVWVKSRVTDAPEAVREDLLGARPATTDRHPIPGLDPVHCTPQLGRPGPWHDRLSHFRLGFTPSSGDELQSEWLVAREHGVAAIGALRGLGALLRPLVHVSEVRTVAADALWLSPQYGQDTVAVHFTWRREPAAVTAAIAEVEAALAPFAPRPHWGKLFGLDAATLAERYERVADFRALAERLDPRGAFRNAWVVDHLLSRA